MQAIPESDGPGSPIAEQISPGLTIALWLAIVVQFGLILVSLVFAALSLAPGASLVDGVAERLAFGVVTLAFPTVGAICLLRRPSQPVGWLLSVVALGWALANAATGYAQYARSASPATLPGVEWALWLSGMSWTIMLSQGLLLLMLLLFPTGSLISSAWRPFARFVVGWTAVSVFAAAFAGGPLEGTRGLAIANPAGVPGETGAIVRNLSGWLLYGFVVLFAVTAYALLLRFRRSSGAERQQIKWLAVATPIVAILAIGLYGGVALSGAVPLSGDPRELNGLVLTLVVLAILSFVLLPAAIGIAILRYRLYDIDLLINRTVVYGALSAILAAAYIGAMAVLHVVLRPFTKESELAVAASTLVVAALVQPLRDGIQRAVDRRFYRRKYDAAKTLETFGVRLRSQVDLDTLRAEVVAAAGETVQPRHASLWLRGGRTVNAMVDPTTVAEARAPGGRR